uniref:Uncharacterized protein n=1 Tax=viral metagenome TaxID=1070528 RepID=A0A6C0LBT0_9ZZZZ
MKEFEENIQKWVSIDNQLKLLHEKTKELREKKAKLSESLIEFAETHQMSNANIEISDGKLKFAKTRVSEPITLKYLEKSLSSLIRNESQVTQIMEHIKQNREVKLVQEIKRFS